MDKILNKIIEWLEYFKKKDLVFEERLNSIEEYLENSTDNSYSEILERLKKLESKEGVSEDDRSLDEETE